MAQLVEQLLPTPHIDQQFDSNHVKFLFTVNCLVFLQEGKLQGTITGGKQLNKAVYVPNAYARAQARWIDDFLAQNGYLEYDALRRLGISDPESTVRRRCKDDEIVFLNSCCVTQSVVDQVLCSGNCFVTLNF